MFKEAQGLKFKELASFGFTALKLAVQGYLGSDFKVEVLTFVV